MSIYKYDNRYAFITGFMRALEAKRVTREIISQLTQAGSIEEAMEIVRGAGYADFFRAREESTDVDALIHWKRAQVLELLEKYTFHGEIVKIFKLGYDYHNIKILLKGKIFEFESPELLVDIGTIEKKEMVDIFKNEYYNLLPPLMNQAVLTAVDRYYTEKHPILIDLVIDRILYKDILSQSAILGNKFIEDFLKLKINLLNIQTSLRGKEFAGIDSIREKIFIPGGTISKRRLYKLLDAEIEEAAEDVEALGYTRAAEAVRGYGESPFAIERECDNILVEYIRPAAYLVWGIEPFFAFGQAMEMELKIIGIILSGKRSGFSPEWMETRLPEPY
ncbi:MAG: V-type ATPase subunit [bacterium]|nr:V-type ATPase subunit [bacterium]